VVVVFISVFLFSFFFSYSLHFHVGNTVLSVEGERWYFLLCVFCLSFYSESSARITFSESGTLAQLPGNRDSDVDI
jgi:hypothetical protein